MALTHVHAAGEGAAPLMSQVEEYLRVPRIRSWATRSRAPCTVCFSSYHGARRLTYRKPSRLVLVTPGSSGAAFGFPGEAVVLASLEHGSDPRASPRASALPAPSGVVTCRVWRAEPTPPLCLRWLMASYYGTKLGPAPRGADSN